MLARRIAELILAVWVVSGVPLLGANECALMVKQNKLPAKLKLRGKPKRADWAQVDRTLNRMNVQLTNGCRFRFQDIFAFKNSEGFFPITHSLLKIVPEGTFSGLTVFDSRGDLLGSFVSRYVYEKSGNLSQLASYSIYYFQYRNSSGDLRSTSESGSLLEGYDRYLFRWKDIQEKIALDGH